MKYVMWYLYEKGEIVGFKLGIMGFSAREIFTL